LPAAVALALVCVLASSALVGCSDDTASSEADTSATGSEVFGQDDARGYSMAATYGDLVWTAGHLPESASPGDSIETQTEAVMKDLEATLEEAGAGFDTVVMTNVYLADFDDWSGFNETYKRYFEGRLPPRVTVEVSSLAFGLIEISMVAHVRDA
jgi:2-iminobutanoate/2-iminopropanoate deaminase